MRNAIDEKYVNRIYRYIKNGMSVEDFKSRYHFNDSELMGFIELAKMYGKLIDIENVNDTLVFNKIPLKKEPFNPTKPEKDKLVHTQFCVVSDTHFGNIHQQLHLLNDIYEEAYHRGIKTVLHCGDVVDGNYPIRPEQPRQQGLHGFDEQASYVVDMYPKIKGIKTKYILGSHDESHYKNGQATVNEWISRCRPDLEYLGQDYGELTINGVKIFMDHPGGGCAESLSYKPQKRIERLESGEKPKMLFTGHYHKSYYMMDRNVHSVLVPALCGSTQFQQKQIIANDVGAYFIDMWSDKKGNIQYLNPEEILFEEKDMWDEFGDDRRKVKQLVIK